MLGRSSCADALSKALKVPAFYDVPSLLEGADLTMASVATGGEEYGSDHRLIDGCPYRHGQPVPGADPIADDQQLGQSDLVGYLGANPT